MSKIFDSEAFKQDITKATENKTEFMDIFCSVFDQVANNKKVFEMVAESTQTL